MNKESKWITGFWRRIGAFFIDAIFLGAIGAGLGFAFESDLVQLGSFGRLFGFSVATIYFGILNSRIFGGQTIGKRILKIRVVNSSNILLSLPRSLIRYVIFGVPFFLNGVQLPESIFNSHFYYFFTTVTFGGALSIFYLYIFNWSTRQSLHDIVVGSYVVNVANKIDKAPYFNKTNKIHYAVVAFVFLTSLTFLIYTKHPSKDVNLIQLISVRDVLINEKNIIEVSVSAGNFYTNKNSKNKSKYLTITAYIRSSNVSDVEFAKKLANEALIIYPDAKKFDEIQVNLVYGFDIGIASKWSNYRYFFTQEEFGKFKNP